MSMLVKERLHDVRGYDLDLRTQLCILGAMFSLMNKDKFFLNISRLVFTMHMFSKQPVKRDNKN